MKTLQYKYIVLLLAVAFAAPVWAQTESSTNSANTFDEEENQKVEFEEVENYYRRGQIDKTIAALQYWLGNSNNMSKINRTRRANIYHLAAQCYILNEKPDTAQIYIEKMLKVWPDYKERRLKSTDIERFVVAVDTLYTLPKFQVGVRTGINYSFVHTEKEYPVLLAQRAGTTTERNSKVNFQVALFAEYQFLSFLSVSVEPGYTQLTHRYERYTVDTESTLEDEIYFDEELTYWDLNLLANFKFFPKSKTRLILSAGVGTAYLASAGKEIDDSNAPLSTINFMNYNTQSLLGRVGFSQRFYGFALGADLTYTYCLSLANSKDSRFLNDPQATIFTYGFYTVPDDFRLSNLQLNFSVRYFLNYKVYH